MPLAGTILFAPLLNQSQGGIYMVPSTAHAGFIVALFRYGVIRVMVEGVIYRT